MLTITLAPGVADRFKGLLAQENNDEAVFRIKEVKVGGG